jgi:hypothetical protein
MIAMDEDGNVTDVDLFVLANGSRDVERMLMMLKNKATGVGQRIDLELEWAFCDSSPNWFDKKIMFSLISINPALFLDKRNALPVPFLNHLMNFLSLSDLMHMSWTCMDWRKSLKKIHVINYAMTSFTELKRNRLIVAKERQLFVEVKEKKFCF